MSFLDDYSEYSSGNEAHPTYHIFCGLVALSSIISRRVWCEMGYFKYFPNLYVVLVGPAGNRKTTAMSIAKTLIKSLETVPFSAEATTKEKLVLDIKEQERVFPTNVDAWKAQSVYSPMTCMVTELSQFLGAGAMGMVDFLTTIYDQDFYASRTKNKGDVEIAGPFLNVLACTTPSWITNYMRSDVISGGFSRRAIFVYETEDAGRVPIPQVTPEQAAAMERAKSHAGRLKGVFGPFRWEPTALEFYKDWYLTQHAQLLKVSMLLALSESTELVFKTEHLKGGLALLGLVETNLSKVFAGVGRNELNAAAVRALEYLRSAPGLAVTINGVTHEFPHAMQDKKLKGLMFSQVNEQEMAQVLAYLKQTDQIGVFQETAGTHTKLYYFLK